MSSNFQIHNIAKLLISWYEATNIPGCYFSMKHTNPPPNFLDEDNTLKDISHYLKIDVPKKGVFEIPLMGGYSIFTSIVQNISNVETITIPLYETASPYESNISATILKDTNEVNYRRHLQRYNLKSSHIFGAKGMLFNSDFKLLCYGSKEFYIDKDKIYSEGLDDPITFQRNILSIDYELFRKDNLISKSIIDNGIIGIVDYNKFAATEHQIHLEFKDLSSIVKVPAPPSNFEKLNDNLLNCLKGFNIL